LGLPEVAPERYLQPLVHIGLYSRVRHPRYLQFLLAQLGWAMVVNYLVIYLVWLLWLFAVYVIVVLEERELRDRLGEEYERYSREVPRFFPHIRRRS
jgi:protein-S-isoprenylcysteine O-methyltransferase Ste14